MFGQTNDRGITDSMVVMQRVDVLNHACNLFGIRAAVN